jgi:hypothetical protein
VSGCGCAGKAEVQRMHKAASRRNVMVTSSPLVGNDECQSVVDREKILRDHRRDVDCLMYLNIVDRVCACVRLFD